MIWPKKRIKEIDHFRSKIKLRRKKMERAEAYVYEKKRNEAVKKLEDEFKAEDDLENEWKQANRKWRADVIELGKRSLLEEERNFTKGINTLRTLSGRELSIEKRIQHLGEWRVVSQNGFEVDENWGEDWQTIRDFPSIEVWRKNKSLWDLEEEINICTNISNARIGVINDETRHLLEDLKFAFEQGHISEQTFMNQYRKIHKDH